MKAKSRRAYYVVGYFLSWGWFAAVAGALNLVCVPLLVLPGRARIGIRVRRAIRSLFRLWGTWFDASGVVKVTWIGFDQPLAAGTIYIANHPTLLDATFILSKLPDAICMMKPALMRNPVIAPAAIMAGYVVSDRPVDTVREAADRVAAGRSLLVFPEGTRTPPGKIFGTVRLGFFLAAARARAPIQLIVIRASPGLAPKGRAWWKPPAVLPGWVTMTMDRRWEWDARRSSAELIAELEERIGATVGETR
jgi:1-acyl-sn-glycerol-3-phosphate acyltransferase